MWSFQKWPVLVWFRFIFGEKWDKTAHVKIFLEGTFRALAKWWFCPDLLWTREFFSKFFENREKSLTCAVLTFNFSKFMPVIRDSIPLSIFFFIYFLYFSIPFTRSLFSLISSILKKMADQQSRAAAPHGQSRPTGRPPNRRATAPKRAYLDPFLGNSSAKSARKCQKVHFCTFGHFWSKSENNATLNSPFFQILLLGAKFGKMVNLGSHYFHFLIKNDQKCKNALFGIFERFCALSTAGLG